MTEPKPYFLFTHTPLHVGAGHSVGYVDLPIQREAHTRIPIVPGSSLKGVLRDRDEFDEEAKEWLFGHKLGETDAAKFKAGALLIGEARVLAFPVRSAKGSFAWITCPLALARYARDAKPKDKDEKPLETKFKDLSDTPKNAKITVWAGSEVVLKRKENGHDISEVVLEEYTYAAALGGDASPQAKWEAHLAELLTNDVVWQQLPGRLVIVPSGIFSFFVQSACEVAQHVAISDETGTAKERALFNQENCPSETLFYGVIAAQKLKDKPLEGEAGALAKLAQLNNKPLQIGGSETTGLGWCTFVFSHPAK